MTAAALRHVPGRLAAWWLREWHASLPDSLRGDARRNNALRIAIEAGQAEFALTLLGRRGEPIRKDLVTCGQKARTAFKASLRRFRRRPGRGGAVLSLVAHGAIEGSLKVPAQALARAGEIVADQVTRRTPFAPGELLIGHEAERADDGKWTLRFAALRRSSVERALAPLGIGCEDLAGLELRDGDGRQSRFLPTRPPPARRLAPGRVAAALLCVTCAAAMVGAASLAWRQHRLLQDLERQVAERLPAASGQAAAMQNAARLIADVSRFDQARAAPGAVQIWEALAETLPDSAYLTEFEIRGDEVLATGYAQSAPDLIRLLERSEVLQGAAFTGPVVQDRERGKEQFAIRATLRQPRLAIAEGEP